MLRHKKTTSLLLAAASVMSLIPMTSAQAAEKLHTKDGNVERAVSYKNGKYLFEGYINEDDDDALYYSNGVKEKVLDDIEDGTIEAKYGNNFVQLDDGGDEYSIDLETGKIDDEEVKSDLKDDAQRNLNKKIKNAGRYDSEIVEVKELNADNKNKSYADTRFEDVYFSYTNKTASSTEAKEKFGYTTSSGKYIDCSYDLNLEVYTRDTTNAKSSLSSAGTVVKLADVDADKKFEIPNAEGTDTTSKTVKVKSLSFVKYLGQDKDYIYSVIKAGIEGSEVLNKGKAFETETVGTDTANVHYYIQKVSKEQGEKEDGAYKPKSTQCFEITKDVISNDTTDAYNLIVENDDAIFTTKGNNVYVIEPDETEKEVKVTKVTLKTDSVTRPDTSTNTRKVKIKAAVKDGDSTQDMMDLNSKSDAASYSIDVNGNVWVINKGKVYKCNDLDWELKYTTDRAMDALDVYDDENLFVWDTEGDVYATLTGESSDEGEEPGDEGEEPGDTETPEVPDDTNKPDVNPNPIPAPPVVNHAPGWSQNADGTWMLFGPNNNKLTGWQYVDANWYFMDIESGVMQTGWLYDGGNWYYLNPNSNGTKGAMVTGWVYDNGLWYYLDASRGGRMLTGNFRDPADGKTYYLKETSPNLGSWVK